MASSISAKRAVGYLRVSSTGQTGGRHSSLETQKARYLEYCDRNELIPGSTYTDVVSGRRDDRREYNNMVENVLQGGADVVVVQFLDRFGRNPKEILRRYWELEEHGVSVVATDEDLAEELLLLVKAGIAGAETRRTSERVRANMARVVQKGVHVARAPFGLRRIYVGRHDVEWELHPTEASVVRKMYRLAVEENLGFKRIGDRLTEQGHRAREGRPLAAFTIQRILSNEAIMGTLAYGKRPRKGNPKLEVVRVPGFFPAILTQEEWDGLQERLAIRRESSRGRTHSSAYLLSGIARCGNCGGPMVGKLGSQWRKRNKYRNYYCSRAMRSKTFCSTYNGHSAGKLEGALLEYLSQFSDPDLVREHMNAAQRRDMETKHSELRDTRKGLTELEHQFMRHLDLLEREILTEQELLKANESIRTQKLALETRQQELDAWLKDQEHKSLAAERVPGAIRSFIDDLEGADVRVQKAHLQTILKAAYIKRDEIEIEFRG
ncbi:MAG: recombinase family protein [SAR202 cluster bacterium]|nr:recombinase family protein [SAR202 cluster bacterium]MDP6801257.1 recombinase family protein [SAR202 cluster bacterium]